MILDFLFPNRCIHCDYIISADDIVCGNCLSQIHFTHFDFYQNSVLKEKCRLLFPVENAFALMKFEEENLSRAVIHELKYKSRETIGKAIAEWTLEKLHFSEDKPELLVTIPLHPKKQRSRGYNQLHLFAETLSKSYEIPYHHSVLKRNSHNSAQAFKKQDERNNTLGLFSVQQSVSNQHILLIDDVFTTGNTMADAAWQLIKSGNKISVLVMAMH